MYKNLIKKNYFLIFIIFSGFPIFFIPNVWDATSFDYGFTINNLSGIESFYKEIGSPFQLIFIYIIFFLKNITNIPHEFLFDFLTVLTLILFSFEIKKYSENVFGLDNEWSNLCAIFAISFPVWHSLVAFNLGLYLVCFYMVLLGYRLFISENLTLKILGIILILFSFSIKSNFSFIIGLSLAHNLILFFNKQPIKKYSLIFIIFLSINSYLIDIKFFSPYGMFDSYNQIKLQSLDIFNLFKHVYNYLTYFIFYLWVPFFYFFILKIFRNNIEFKNLLEKRIIINYFAIIIIFCATIAPYVLVEKTSDLFSFRDYYSRHAYLLSLSFGLFFSILLKKIHDTCATKNIHLFILTLFILQNLLILSIGYYTKIESAVFRYDFVEKLKKVDQPPGGNVQIFSNQIPAVLRSYEVSHLFYKAYGKASWFGSATGKNAIGKDERNIEKNSETLMHILERNDYKTLNILNDYNEECNIVIELTEEIGKFDRIFKIYIWNFRDYFKIKFLKITC